MLLILPILHFSLHFSIYSFIFAHYSQVILNRKLLYIYIQYKNSPLNYRYKYLPLVLGSDSRSLSVVDARLSPLYGELGVDIIYKLQAAQWFHLNFSAYSPIIPALFRIL